MSASLARDIHEVNAGQTPEAALGNDPEMKTLDPDAPYKHAPPKDGDPWTTILTPELEADTLRCNAWKEEVQNVLIFAGLFSGVATAFVNQSYKLLEPDPNNTVIALLFHIANGQNNSSPFPPAVNPQSIFTPFSQTNALIRINVFWFLSLILALTTVLIGTIALQWLREHQSYIGYSGKERVAILHMRKEAAEAWYLPQVFAALPLLLQAALVLFLAGLVEFTLPLGRKITIPIAFVIGLILLFLSATTILPSLQGLAFFFRIYPQDTLPTPCPYKSPQSLAFRKLYGIVLRTIFRIFPPPSLGFESNPKSNSLGWVMKNASLLMPEHLAPSAYDLWYQQTWLTIDREWLSLRDACHQRLLDDDPDLYHHRILWKRSFPLSDITQSLVEAVRHTPGMKHTESFLAAIVHCFQELSESIWTAPQRDYHFQRPDRRNKYFEQLHCRPTCSMSKFLLHGGDYQFDRFGKHDYGLSEYMEPKITQRLFCDDQTVIFLRMLLENHNSPRLSQYQLELWSRTLQFSNHVAPLTTTRADDSSVPIPTVIEYPLIYSMIPDYFPDQRISTISNVLSTLLKLAASHRISRDQSMNSLCTHSHMVDVLNSLAYLTTLYLRVAPKDTLTITVLTRRHTLREVDNQFVKIFEFIGDHLNKNLSDSSSNSQEISLDVFFYFSSIFTWGILHWLPDQEVYETTDRHFGQAFETLLDALHKTWISGRRNELIETRFEGHFGGYDRFSDKWWHQLFQHVSGLQIRATEQGPHAPKESLADSGPDPLPSKLVIHAENKTASHLPSPISPDVIDRSPAVLLHPASSAEGPYIADSFSLPASESLLDGPGGMQSLHHDPILEEAEPLSIPQLVSPSDTTGATGVTLRHTMGNGTSHSNDNHLQLSERHLVIDARSPILVPQEATVNVTSPSDGHGVQSSELLVAIDVDPPSILVGMGAEVPVTGDHLQDVERSGDAVIHFGPPI